MSLPTVNLNKGAEKRVERGHPWIYSNEIAMTGSTKNLPRGTLVEFRTQDNRFLGRGSFNAHCLIAGRFFTQNPLEQIDVEWLNLKIKNALLLREELIPTPYYRLIHADADGLPGLIVDRFGESIVVQQNSAGMELLSPLLLPLLQEILKPKIIILRNDSAIREMEGLPRTTEVYLGGSEGPIEVLENGLIYLADLTEGQKTGWYFDQRDNHAVVADLCKKSSSVLDLYCHTGGFALLAAQRGAKNVLGIDSSAPALLMAEKAASKNQLHNCSFKRGDVFEELEQRYISKETYDVVIADPPTFVKSRKDLSSGTRGYRKLTRLAAQVTEKDGFFFIASCSHNMNLEDFQAAVASGLHDAKRQARLLKTTFAAPDHPVHPMLPESAYLKALLFKLS